MSYEYEEVVNLVLRTNDFNVGLNTARAMFGRAKSDLDKLALIEMRVGDKLLKFDLDKAYKNVSKAAEDAEKAKLESKRKALVISAEISRQATREDERAQIASIKKVEERFEAAEKAKLAAQKQRIKEAAQFNNIFTTGGRPLALDAAQPMRIHTSAVLRAGAGAAGMLGMYPAAGALYGTANAMQALGHATMSASKAFAIFTPIVVGLGTAFAAVKFITYGAEFSRELARMSTLMLSTSATAEEFSMAMDKTAQSAFKISQAFNLDAVDVVKAFKDALSSGIDVGDLERFTTIAATLSAATATSIQDTANLLTSIKDSYSLTVGEMTHQTDLLFNAINVGKIQIPAYVNGFARLSDAGAAAGISLDDLHVAIATMTRQGMPANRVMTSMVALIHGLQSPSEQAKKAMEELGIVFGDAAFEGKSFMQVVEEIKIKTRGGVGSVIGDVFDDERARQAIRSLVQGVNLAKTEIIPGMAEVGTSAVAADRAMNNLFDNWEKSVLSVTNAIKASSAETGGWFNQLLYGGKDKEKADFVAKMEQMKAIAASGIARGQSKEQIERSIMAVTNPRLFAADGVDRFAKGERPSGTGYSDTMFSEDNLDLAGIQDHMTKSAAAMAQAYAEAKDSALISIREINKEFDKSLRNIFKNLDALEKHNELKKLSTVAARALGSRATDNQKQIMLDLQEDIEIQKSAMAEAREKLEEDVAARQMAYRDKNIQPILDDINKATKEGGDLKSVPALHEKLRLAQAEFRVFMKSVDDELKNSTALAPFVSEVNNLTSAIERMRTRIGSQDTKVERDRKEAANREKEKAGKKAAAEELKLKEDFTDRVERLYRADVANYKKAQEERKALFEKIDDEILGVARRNARLQSDLRKDALDSVLSEKSDDPAAQLRIARSEKERNLEELKRIAAKGEDTEALRNAISRYRDSADAQRDAGGSVDKRRAERVFRDDLDILGRISEQFSRAFGDSANARKAGISTNDNSVAIRSPQELAKAAAVEQQKQAEVTKIVTDIKLNMQVDGNLSEKSQTDIANKVVEKVRQMLKNNNPSPSVYDSRTRNPTTAIGVFDE